MKKESNNIATNNQVFVVCGAQTLNPHQTESSTRIRPENGARLSLCWIE